MINLIPEEGKRVVRREYLVRVVSVFGLLFAAALCIGALLLVPTYVLLARQLSGNIEAGIFLKDTEAEYARTMRALKDAEKIAQRLAAPTRSIGASEILTHVETSLSSDIALSGLSVSGEEGKIVVIARGSASTRESLRLFVERLRRDAFFTDASVPVSDLAPDVNLSFTVTLTLRTNLDT